MQFLGKCEHVAAISIGKCLSQTRKFLRMYSVVKFSSFGFPVATTHSRNNSGLELKFGNTRLDTVRSFWMQPKTTQDLGLCMVSVPNRNKCKVAVQRSYTWCFLMMVKNLREDLWGLVEQLLRKKIFRYGHFSFFANLFMGYINNIVMKHF